MYSGIGDYTFNTALELVKRNDITIFTFLNKKRIKKKDGLDISQLNINAIIKFINVKKKIVILQVPFTQCCKTNLLLVLICFVLFKRNSLILTIHEYKNINFLRRFSILLASKLVDKIVFTNRIELDNFMNNRRKESLKVNFIPLASNVKISYKSYPNQKSNKIIMFSLIYKDKMILEAINFFISLKRYFNEFELCFIGGEVNNNHKYHKDVKKLFDANEIKYFLNITNEQIDYMVKDSFLAIQFYNDGASLRRGSLLAMIDRGIPIITNKGEYGEELISLERKGIFYRENTSIISDIERLIIDSSYYEKCSKELINFSDNYSFTNIGDQYQRMIEELK